MIPGVTGLGMLAHADEAYDALRFANRTADGFIPASDVYKAYLRSSSDEFIHLYHGTSKASAKNIRKGIDPAYFQPNRDFGYGFYTTIDKNQAINWAKDYGDDASILHFKIPKDEFESLVGYSFRGTSDNWYEFVTNNRLDWTNPSRYSKYDYINGTMLLNPKEYIYGSGIIEAAGQQTVFFTQKSFDILLRSLVP